MFVVSYSFTLTHHAAARPWIVTHTEHRTIELGDDVDFHTWANQQWPGGDWTVQLDPHQLNTSRRLS